MNLEFSCPRSWCHAGTHSVRFSLIIFNSSRLELFVLLEKKILDMPLVEWKSGVNAIKSNWIRSDKL